MLPSWEVALRSERKSRHTLAQYREGVRQFLRWCERTGTAPELSKPTVQGFLAALFDDGAQAATVRARYLALRRFSHWLTAEGEIEADRLLGMSPPKLAVKITDPLTEAELRDLIKACQGPGFADRRDEAICRLMAETGMRAGECASLAVADVDTLHGRAVIRSGKGGRDRPVPFGPQTATVLDRYIRMRRSHKLAERPSLWLPVRAAGSFGYTSLYRALRRRAALVGLDTFHPHLLRHTAASRWLAAGGSEGGLMTMAGWKQRQMLDRYTAATASERAADEAKRLRLGDL
ncbi:integrase [Mycobacterium seoulense]|uniref:Integrase n=1 Tax=Mycobacterium seoulense TaxID=386911 RepID=A0A7I7NXV3_9MYCO|nr:integrase [Mycobacterium seoulense]